MSQQQAEHERLVYIERSLRELKLALANGGSDSLKYALQLLLALKAFVRTCTGREERAWLARRVAEVRAECTARNAADVGRMLVGLLADLERMTVSDGAGDEAGSMPMEVSSEELT